MFVLNSTRGECTQAEINRAAHQIFQERGFHDTSMRDIARKAGIAIGGFYNHISSKEGIFLNVFIEHHPDRAILPAINFVQEETIETFVRDAADRMLEALGESQDFLILTFIELVEFKGKNIPIYFVDIYLHSNFKDSSDTEASPIGEWQGITNLNGL